MIRVLVFLLLAASPVLADPERVATVRVGVADFFLNNPLADDQITGTGLTFAGELALRSEGWEAGVAIEVAQFTARDYEGFQPVRDIRERLVSATARLRYSFTDFFDVTAGVGGAITFEHETRSDHYHGYRYEAAAGFRIWHRHGQAVRIEGCLANTHLVVSGMNGVDFSILQAGVSVGYLVTF